MTRRPRCLPALLLLLITLAWSGPAWAADTDKADSEEHRMRFHVMSETIGDAYQLVRSDNELLNRRRLHQYLGLGAYNILQDEDHQVSFVSLMRFDSDLGMTQDELDVVSGLKRDQLSIQTFYLDARDLWGIVDLRLGRQLHYDTIDFMMLDGLTATTKLPGSIGVEVQAGLEADNDVQAYTSSQFELDGTRALEGDDALSVTATKIVLGGALVTHSLHRFKGRIGYRRIFSDEQINQEKVSAAFTSRPMDPWHLDAAVSFDMFNDYVDTIRVGNRVRVGDVAEMELQYVRLLPSFDADSIFNIFTAEPLNDLNARARYYLTRSSWFYMGGMVRLFGADPTNIDGDAILGVEEEGVKAYGAMAGWSHRYGTRGRVSLDASHESGYGGDRTLLDLDGRYALRPGVLELDGRITGVLFADELQSELRGTGGGYQLGMRYLVDDRASLQFMVEQNFNAIHTNQFRVFAVADLDLWM